MEAIAADHAGRPLRMFTVYVREPHPGGDYPQPRTFDERLRHAADCCAADHARIPVIVDDMDDSVHQAFGGLPNMVYVIDSRGKVAYRATWTHHEAVRAVVERLLAFDEAKASGRPVMGGMPSWSEQALPPDPAAGPQGLVKAIEVWESVKNYDEPERFLGPEVAQRFRDAYKALTGKDSVRPA